MVANAHQFAPPPPAVVPRQPMTLLEVVSHPQGGWTIAVPVDASRCTVRIFRGWWATEAAAQRFLELNILGYAR
jgi:hypothetical protein